MRRRLVAFAVTVAMIAFAALSQDAWAETDVTDEFPVAPAPDAGAQKVAYNAVGDSFLMVWVDEVLLAQLLDESGQAVGAARQISPDMETIRGFDVAATRDAFVVTWSNWDSTWATENETFARIVTVEGLPVGDPVTMSAQEHFADFKSVDGAPTLAVDAGRGQLLVVWVTLSDDEDVVGLDRDVVGRLLTDDLTPIGEVFQISRVYPPGDFEEGLNPGDLDVAFDPIGDVYVVVFADFYYESPDTVLYITTVSPGAEVLDPSVEIGFFAATSNLDLGAEGPVVSIDPAVGEYLVVWSGIAPPPQGPAFRGIVARTYDRTLTPTGPVFEVAVDTEVSSDVEAVDPAIVWLPSQGEHLVVWSGARASVDGPWGQVGIDRELRGARIADGALAGAPFDITLPNGVPSDVSAPSLAARPGGDPVLATWTEAADTGVRGTWLTSTPDPVTGYLMLEADGRTHGFGDATGLEADSTSSTVVDLAMTPTMNGYWRLADDGSVSEFGDAPEIGDVDLGTLEPGESVTTIASTATGAGYWVFTDRGRAIGFGDAPHIGDVTHLDLDGSVIDSVATPSGGGYYLLGSDGGVFTFGDAVFHGSVPQVLPGVTLDGPVVGIVPTPTGNGYWLVATDGGVFAFGDAGFLGSVPQVLPGVTLDGPVNGMVAFGNGYLMVASDGGVFTFSDLQFLGSLGGVPTAHPVVGIVAVVR